MTPDARSPGTSGSSAPRTETRRPWPRPGPGSAAALAATAALPSGVQHADLTLTNVLLDEARAVSGVVDLGDMHHTAAICDAAVSLTAVLRNSGPLRVPWSELAAAFLDGYQRVRPLWPEEAAVLGHLVLARLVTTLDISRSRADEHPDNRDTIVQYDATSTAPAGGAGRAGRPGPGPRVLPTGRPVDTERFAGRSAASGATPSSVDG